MVALIVFGIFALTVLVGVAFGEFVFWFGNQETDDTGTAVKSQGGGRSYLRVNGTKVTVQVSDGGFIRGGTVNGKKLPDFEAGPGEDLIFELDTDDL